MSIPRDFPQPCCWRLHLPNVAKPRRRRFYPYFPAGTFDGPHEANATNDTKNNNANISNLRQGSLVGYEPEKKCEFCAMFWEFQTVKVQIYMDLKPTIVVCGVVEWWFTYALNVFI